jgi:hypothetical protein
MPNAPVGAFVELLVQSEELARDAHSHSLLGRLADREANTARTQYQRRRLRRATPFSWAGRIVRGGAAGA